jgi:DNA repair protein RecN (Recombination protein N)
MLTGLSIRNVVIIETLNISFGDGLSVLTGETGAGKSILLDSLGLALGGRSEARLLRPGADQAVVTAEFALPPESPIEAMLTEQGIESEGDLFLRRALGSDGRSRAFVNDQPVSIGFLRQIGDALVEIQGQFDERGLMNQATHRDVLDAFAGLGGQTAAVRAAFATLQRTRSELAQAKADAERARADEDFLRHAADELAKLAPAAGEEAQLADTRQLLMNAEQVAEALKLALTEIEGEDGADSRLRKALGQIQRAAGKAGGALDAVAEALERTVAESDEAMSALANAAADIDLDGSRLAEVEERLYALRDIARKHRVEVDDLPALRERIDGKLALVENQTGRLDALAAAERKAREDYTAKAETLRAQRHQAAAGLDKAVNAELPPLKLEKAAFSTAIEALPEDQWGENGIDRISFQVTTNPGTPPGPLSKIASGGELSRFMLALKVVLAAAGGPTTLVFDEVDSGVGGATADAVGQRLAQLAGARQVLVVTHSPQVAARGNDHLRVEKHAGGANDMVTGVDRLIDGDRREEIARMLSGSQITDEARAAADRLIHGGTA